MWNRTGQKMKQKSMIRNWWFEINSTCGDEEKLFEIGLGHLLPIILSWIVKSHTEAGEWQRLMPQQSPDEILHSLLSIKIVVNEWQFFNWQGVKIWMMHWNIKLVLHVIYYVRLFYFFYFKKKKKFHSFLGGVTRFNARGHKITIIYWSCTIIRRQANIGMIIILWFVFYGNVQNYKIVVKKWLIGSIIQSIRSSFSSCVLKLGDNLAHSNRLEVIFNSDQQIVLIH